MFAVIIPAYNPNIVLNKIITQVSTFVEKIIIIDDGSSIPITSNSKEAIILRNDQNSGKGYSLNRGFKYAMDNNINHVITLDSDGQHDTNCIPDFLNIDPEIDIVIGNRNFSDNMPIHRRISNTITSFILSLRCGVKILDSQCGFRRYKLDALNSHTFNESGFHFESEVLIKSLGNGGTLAHINIPTIYNGETSYISHFKDSVKFILLIIRSLFW